MTLPILRSLRSQLRSRLTATSTNRDVTASIIRSLISKICSLPPSTKDILEGGRERILETKLNTSFALFGYKDLFSTTFLFLFSRVLTMGNSLDCCYNSRWSYQCIFPCIRFCTYSGRRVFYNFDGMEKVQPLVHIYHPRNERVHRFPEAFYGIDDDDDIKNQMQSHDGVYTNIYKS